MLQLHYFPGNASLIPHIVLEELGVPFELKYVDRAVAAHKSADYLALNPNGLIPVLVDPSRAGSDGKPLVLYETAAICLHLADTHPATGLMPPLGSGRARAGLQVARLADQHAAGGADPLLLSRALGRRSGGGAGQGAAPEEKIGAMLDQLDAELARHGGPWLLGAELQRLRSLRVRALPLDARLRAGRRATCRI